MSCVDKVLDVFVTKDHYDFDEEHQFPVWSIRFADRAKLESGEAWVVNEATDWFMPAMNIHRKTLEVGDQVRIGDNSTTGFTDYLTILEKVQVTHVRNAVAFNGHPGDAAQMGGTSGDLEFIFPNDANKVAMKYMGNILVSSAANTTGVTLSAPTNIDGPAASFAPGGLVKVSGVEYAYRINAPYNLTLPPPHPKVNVASHRVVNNIELDKMASGPNDYERIKDRHELAYSVHRKGASAHEQTELQMAYGLFKVNPYTTNGMLRASLDHGVKAIRSVTLKGYSLFHKRRGGLTTNSEVIDDDWIALKIDQVPGHVISNNPTANGAFCVLHGGTSHDDNHGSVELLRSETRGLHTHVFETPTSSVRHLDLRFLNRKGEPAHFGRIHLWFQLCVAHG